MENNQTKHGQITSIIGIALNVVLATVKIVVGALFGLISVLADGLNNFSDCGGGVVSFVSLRVAAKPADKEHPYGHQRAEYIASMIIGIIILMLAVELLRGSIDKCISGEVTTAHWLTYAVLGASILVKAGMFVLYQVSYRRTNFDALKAAAIDSACDCIATAAVILGLVLAHYFNFAADGYAGIFVALFILWQGFAISREAGSKLLGQAPDPALPSALKELILQGEGVLGVHDLRVYRYGPHTYFATAHIEMDANLPALGTHAVIDGIERNAKKQLGVELTGHYDPVDLNDRDAKEIEERIRGAAEGLYEGLELHDFRLVRGVQNKILFEAGVPFSLSISDAKIKSELEKLTELLTGYEPVVTVERE